MTGRIRKIARALEPAPCEACGVKGGSRHTYGEIVDNEIVRRSLCAECRKWAFLRPFDNHDRTGGEQWVTP